MRFRELLAENFGYTQDNPALRDGEEGKLWLQRKQDMAEYAKETASSYRGSAYYLLMGSVTATMGGIAPMYFPAKLLDIIPGCMDEARKPGEGQFDRLIKKVEENGFDMSHHNAVLVGVNHKGDAYVIEGNTRSSVARHLGIRYIPCEFRWFNGGEMYPGDWTPSIVSQLSHTTPRP